MSILTYINCGAQPRATTFSGNSDAPSVLNPDAPTSAPDSASASTDTPSSPAPATGTDDAVSSSASPASDTPAVDPQPPTGDSATTQATAETGSDGSDATGTGNTLPKEWQQGATYQAGEQVLFGGDTYAAVSQHNAAAFNWTPPQAPALWTKVTSTA